MNLSELTIALSACRSDGSPIPPVDFTGATADSRQVRPGMLFCAIRGARCDGNAFIPDACARGAAAIVSDAEEPPELPVPVIRVRPQEGYHAIARVAAFCAGFPAKTMMLLGITGTCGKTTTAFLLRDILRQAGIPCGMIGTVVYDLGNGEEIEADRTTPTPFELQQLFLRMKDNGVTHVVMECSSAAMVQRRFDDAKFAVTAFTNFSRDHLDFHGTMEDYYQAKKLLFTRDMPADGVAVINGDDEGAQRLYRELRQECPELVLRRFSIADESSWYQTPLAGAYNRYNAQCAAEMAEALGISPAVIAAALAVSPGAPGRLQRVECPNGVSAFVDYAHTPEEIAVALKALRPMVSPGQRLAILFGCGGDRDRGKRPQMGQAAADHADIVFLTSDNPRTEDPQAILADILPAIPSEKLGWCNPDRKQAIARAVQELHSGDILLIAGKGHESYQEINGVKKNFSDLQCLKTTAFSLTDSPSHTIEK